MKVTIKDMVKSLDLEVLSCPEYLNKEIKNELISRPGLELTGYISFFESDRVMILGTKEMTYLNTLSLAIRKSRLSKLMNDLPCIITSVNVAKDPVLLDLSIEKHVPILKSTLSTTQLYSQVFAFLRSMLAPRLNIHGELLEVYGLGVMLIGKSGIGKSEVALELIKRGHILISDDRVDVYEVQPGFLVGHAPKILEKYIEIRGLGICDVVSLFGIGAYRENKRIRLVIELENWNQEKIYDRLGLDQEIIKYYNTELPKNTIPILPGRSVATLIEAAVLNQKQKYLGYNAVENLIEAMNKKMESGNDE